MLMSMLAPLEALLFAAGSNGLTTEEIASAMGLSLEDTKSLCEQLQQQFEQRNSGLQVVDFAGNWQLVTRPEFAEYIRRLATSPVSGHLSAAALEVLAIVAYRQPITRQGIELIRGVQSDRALSTLVHRQLVAEKGREDAPGRPILYGTTDVFLQTFGLRSLEELPLLPSEQELPQTLSLFENHPSIPRD